MKGNGCPPRVLDDVIEMMFPFATLGGLNFDARLLSIQPVDDAKYEGSEDSDPGITKCECRGRAASDNEACNRNLIRCDSRFAKT